MNLQGFAGASLQLPSQVRYKTYGINSRQEWIRYGKWMISGFECELDLVRVWKQLQSLIDDGTLQRIDSSTARMTWKNGRMIHHTLPARGTWKNGIIMCDTRPGISEIKRAAEAIQSKIHSPYAMRYETNRRNAHSWDKDSVKCQYLYTPMGRFYERDAHGRWILVKDEQDNNGSGRSETDHGSNRIQPGFAAAFFQLPSNVLDKKYIRMPDVDSVVESDQEWTRCGKWTISRFDSWLDHDAAWIQLQSLIDDGTLLMIESSTAGMRMNSGIIICYTRPGKSEIKRAAKAIQRIIHSPYDMTYKTNERSEHRCNEDSVKCLYLYKPMGRFYERDAYGRWILVIDEQDNNGSGRSETDHGSNRIQPGFAAAYFQLPSKVLGKKYICMPDVDSVVESDQEWTRCGKWMISGFDNWLDQDAAWMQLQSLIVDGTLLMIKSSTARTIFNSGIIICYTRPGKSEIKRAAEAIQRIIHSPFDMPYKTNERSEQSWDEDFVKCEYLYTPMGRFYERDAHGRWILVKDEQDNNGSGRYETDHGSGRSQTDHGSNRIEPRCAAAFFQLPSKVLDKKYVRMPDVDSVVESDQEWTRCGKWTISRFDNWLDHDAAWMQLQSLIDDGTLLMIESSTAGMRIKSGIIICYTRPGKSEIKRAAKAIQSKIHSPYDMTYKTNERSEQSWDEDSVKCLYLYKPMRGFYERDAYGRWILVKDEQDNNGSGRSETDHGSNRIQPDFSLASVSPAPEDRFHLVRPDFSSSKLRYWRVTCDFALGDENGQTELGKVQIVAKELFEKGVFPKIIRWELFEELVPIDFYIPEPQDNSDILNCVHELRKVLFYPHFISYFEYDYGEMPKKKFVHTPEGEIFECVPTKTSYYTLKTLS